MTDEGVETLLEVVVSVLARLCIMARRDLEATCTVLQGVFSSPQHYTGLEISCHSHRPSGLWVTCRTSITPPCF